MSADTHNELRKLEGRSVHLCLTDGSRMDNVSLVSARGTTLWIFSNGEDAFVPVSDVIDFWEAAPAGRSAA